MKKPALNLRCELGTTIQDKRRWRGIIQFLKKFDLNGAVLDIGEINPFGYWLAQDHGLVYNSTVGDLDCDLFGMNYRDNYDVVFCFDVLEHLMNPLLCLKNIAKFCKTDTKIFISVPRSPQFLWWENHWHEFDKYRFEHLVKSAGLEILEHKEITTHFNWWFYLTGFRPLLRLLIFRPKVHIYSLRIKTE